MSALAAGALSSAATSVSNTLRFDDGEVQFRQRVVCSLLSRRPLLIRNIRNEDENPGLRDYEASFLRLIDSITNGTTIEINETGTQLRLRPGVIVNGDVTHECSNARSVAYYLEGLLPLAPFGKSDLRLTLTGVTDGLENEECSVDFLAASFVPLYRHFGVGVEADESSPPSLLVQRRGAAPLGGGSVTFYCPLAKSLRPVSLLDAGLIKKVRGAAVSCKIPPTSSARVAFAAKGVLHRLLPDVWIKTDSHSAAGKGGSGCGPSPGLKVVLTSESTTGVCLSAEQCIDPEAPRGSVMPEDLGVGVAAALLEEVKKGGCVDSATQSFVFFMMCLCPDDVSRVKIGTLSKYAIVSLRLFKEVFGVEFKIKADTEEKTVTLSCLGTGFRNYSKRVT